MEKLLPLDFSIFTDWEFVHEQGNYLEKHVCIMSAAYLAVQIAKGRTTLEKVLTPKINNWGGRTPNLDACDRVSCVSDVLRNLLINRNDDTDEEEDLREWAIRMLPRIVGTKLGKNFEGKLERELRDWRRKQPWYDSEGEEDEDDQEDSTDLSLSQKDEEIEFVLALIETERTKRATALEKRRATLAAKKGAQA